MVQVRKTRIPVLVSAVLALALAGGCGLTGKSDAPKNPQLPAVADVSAQPLFTPAADAPDDSPSPSVTPTTAKPSPSKTKKATPKPSTSKPAGAPVDKNEWWGQDQLPDCAHYDTTKPASHATVKSDLQKSAARVYWHTEAPNLRINYPLIKAVAYQESGWQTNIHNCDGGTGLMQVMPNTVTMINNRFGLAYDPSVLQDNADLGGNYLAWLTKWMGDHYFKGDNYVLSASKCKTTTSWCLLNTVIAGYNAGSGSVDALAASKKLPNPQYVSSVRSLMTRCKCDQY